MLTKSDIWVKSGTSRRLPLKSFSMEGCCDCGLVHRVGYYIRGGRLYQRVWRDDERTANGRRKYRFVKK